MEVFDLDLLLSVAGGLGRWQEQGSRRVYVKDPDALGRSQALREQQRGVIGCGSLRSSQVDAQRISHGGTQPAPDRTVASVPWGGRAAAHKQQLHNLHQQSCLACLGQRVSVLVCQCVSPGQPASSSIKNQRTIHHHHPPSLRVAA